MNPKKTYAKRTLAALLAVMMVFAMIPTTVFAVAEECAVKAQFGSHSKDYCELAGVAYTKVEGSSAAPACGQDGFTMYKCACGEFFADDIIPMDPHNYIQMNYPGNDCTAAERVCIYCGEADPTWKPEEKHNWNYADPHAIVKAPTAHDEGEAIFGCANEYCSVTKSVVVHTLDHMSTMELVQAKAPDCKNEGNIAYYHCSVCEKNYVLEGGLLVEVEDVTLPSTHAWNQDLTIIPATCTTWGFSYYGCPLCGAKKDFTELEPLGHTYYKCAEHGMEWDDACEACADAKLSTDYVLTEPTCTKNGKHAWYCGRCDKAITESISCTGHDLVTVTVPATCGNAYTYTFSYCANESCKIDCVDSVYTTLNGDGLTLDVTVEIREDENVYDLPSDHPGYKIVGGVTVRASSAVPAHFYTGDNALQAPTCTKSGKVFWYCQGCNDNYSVDLAALGHALSEEKAYTTVPTCGTAGYDYYYCSRCEEYVPDLASENPIAPNMAYMGNAALGLDARDEFEREHPGFDGEYEIFREGSCTEYGYRRAYCAACDWTYLVLVDGTGEGHKRPADAVYHAEATCTQYQGWEAYTCTICGENVSAEVEVKALGHEMTKIAAKTPTCDMPGNRVYYTCSNECCKDIAYRNTSGTAVWKDGAQILPATGHNMSQTVVHPNCVTSGYIHHVCLNDCGNEWVDGYSAAIGPLEGDSSFVAPTCTQGGYKTIYCIDPYCTGDDGIADTADDGIHVEILPATGHKNKDGETIFDICTDTVTDRSCVNENCPIEKDENGCRPVAKSHYVVKSIVEADCTHSGYTMQTCTNGCGELDQVINVLDPLGHALSEEKAYTTWPSCDGTAGYDYYYCSRCEEYVPDLASENKFAPNKVYMGNAALGLDARDEFEREHPGFDGNYVEYRKGNCALYGYWKAYCAACDWTYLVLVDGTGEGHKRPADAVYHAEATCTHYKGWEACNCAVCGEEIAEEVEAEALDHLAPWGLCYTENDTAEREAVVSDYGYTLNNDTDERTYYIAPTYTTTGEIAFICCNGCDNVFKLEVIRTAVDITLEIDNAVVSGEFNAEWNRFVDSDVIAIDVYVNAYDVDFWGFNFDVQYDTNTMNYLGYVFNAGETFGSYWVDDHDGMVSISAYTEQRVNVNITGKVAVATLYFQIEGIYECEGEYFYADVGYAEVQNAWMSNSEGDEEQCAGASVSFIFADMMDTNDNDICNIKDLQNCYDIIRGVAGYEYLAAADADKDGIVNLVDLYLLNMYLIGAATELDIYAALDWETPEGFVAG